jgi:hypothetical protein
MAQQIDCELKIRFSRTGKPINVELEASANYSIHLVLMTMAEEHTICRISKFGDQKNFKQDEEMDIDHIN